MCVGELILSDNYNDTRQSSRQRKAAVIEEVHKYLLLDPVELKWRRCENSTTPRSCSKSVAHVFAFTPEVSRRKQESEMSGAKRQLSYRFALSLIRDQAEHV